MYSQPAHIEIYRVRRRLDLGSRTPRDGALVRATGWRLELDMTDAPNGDPRDSRSTHGASASHPLNARVANIRGGLEKVVRGREEVISATARTWAERLDRKYEGRHHEKLQLAVRVVDFIVEHTGAKDAGDGTRAASGAARGRARAQGASARGGRDEPEDLGEFIAHPHGERRRPSAP